MASDGTMRVYRVAASVLLLASLAALWLLAVQRGWSAQRLEDLLGLRPVLAPVIFVLLHCVAAAAFIPCSPFTIVAGVLWGPVWGLLISVLAAWLASCLTFLVGRYALGSEWRSRLARSSPGQALARLTVFGWRGVAFAQLNPVLPASTLGYLFGLSQLPLPTYAWSALVFMLPLQVALVGLGGSLRDIALADKTPVVVLVVAAVAMAVYFIARRMTRELIRKEEHHEHAG